MKLARSTGRAARQWHVLLDERDPRSPALCGFAPFFELGDEWRTAARPDEVERPDRCTRCVRCYEKRARSPAQERERALAASHAARLMRRYASVLEWVGQRVFPFRTRAAARSIGVPMETARRYLNALEEIGLVVQVEPAVGPRGALWQAMFYIERRRHGDDEQIAV